jgi:hypothetical protein
MALVTYIESGLNFWQNLLMHPDRSGRDDIPVISNHAIRPDQQCLQASVTAASRCPYACPPMRVPGIYIATFLLLVLLHAIPAKRGKVRPADKLQVKAVKLLPLVGLARSKEDPINRGHGAQYLYRPPPTGANPFACHFPIAILYTSLTEN